MILRFVRRGARRLRMIIRTMEIFLEVEVVREL